MDSSDTRYEFLKKILWFTMLCLGGVACSTPPEQEEMILIVPGPDAGDVSDMAQDSASDMVDSAADVPSDMPAVPDMIVVADSDADLTDMAPDLVEQEDMSVDMGSEVVVEPGPRAVASFNVELFFDDVCDSGDCEEGDFERLYSMTELSDRILETGGAIARLNADVIVLQEVEKLSLFESLAMTSMLGYEGLVFGDTGRTGSIHVAIATRGELLEVKRHRANTDLVLEDGSTSRFARELLEVHTRVDGAYIIVFGAHFISKYNPSNTPRRVAEAREAARLAVEAKAAHPEALVVIAGDLNDTPDSEPLLEFRQQGFHVTSDNRLVEDVYTNVYGFDLQIIDHILYLDAEGVTFSESDGLEVFRDDGAHGLAGSDHAAPKAVFTWDGSPTN